MKIKSVVFTIGAFTACVLLQACGGSSSSGGKTPPPASSQSQTQTFDSAQISTLAQTSSETSDPIVVNDGAVTVSGGSDESSDPIPLNQ